MSDLVKKNDPKIINGWAMYDWANSVYMLVITSAIFPAYYNKVTRVDGSSIIDLWGFPIENTAAYSITLGISFGIIALISPLLSSISDYTGNPKSFMKFFAYTGAIACACLFFFTGENVELALVALLFATIGYSGSIVFYNAYLPEIASPDRQDQVSARGYMLGYTGACTLLVLNLVLILQADAFGITDGTLPPRIAFLSTGIWWAAFAQIPFRRLPNKIFIKQVSGDYLMNGYRELLKIWDRLKELPLLRAFLRSFFFYTMGLQTVMFMAASFGEKEVGLATTQLIIVVLINQLVGIVGAFLFARLSKSFGNLKGLIIGVFLWIGITISAYFITTASQFYVAAVLIGMVMGGLQALSRSTYAKMIPKTENNAGYFSFYDVCEKIAIMIGLVLFGYLDNLFGSMRYSIIALAVFFVLGLIFLLRLQYRLGSQSLEIVGRSQ